MTGHLVPVVKVSESRGSVQGTWRLGMRGDGAQGIEREFWGDQVCRRQGLGER